MKPTENEIRIAKNIVDMLMKNDIATAVIYHRDEYDCWDNDIHEWACDKNALLEDEGIRIYHGETKACIISDELENWVIKVGFCYPEDVRDDYDKNFGELEESYYKQAEEKGLGDFFAATYHLCDRGDISFFIQERAENDEDVISDSFYNYESKIYHENADEDEAEDEDYASSCISDAVDCMDDEDRIYAIFDDYKGVSDLIDFCNENHINDLHEGNFGITKSGAHKIIDFSGYW